MKYLLLATVLLAAPPAAAQDTRPLAERLYGVVASGLPNGPAPGRRANHIKGEVFEGSFTASPVAATLSVAQQFQGGAVPLVIRFSNVGGIPDVADNSPTTSIRAMAVRFAAPGGDISLVCINMPVFISRTPEDFLALNLAGQSAAPKDVHPTPFEQWAGSHPEVGRFLGAPRPMPVSFATQDYYPIHAYKLVDAAGAAVFVRFHIVPTAGRQFLSAEDAAKAAPDALFDGLRASVAAAPVAYRLEAQIAEAGDATDDPTVAWPDSRRVVVLGTISVTHAVADNDAAERSLVFMPNQTVKGFELSDDPFIQARAAVYGVAYEKRRP